MSERALRLIFEWLEIHRDEVKDAWDRAAAGEEPGTIEPLK